MIKGTGVSRIVNHSSNYKIRYFSVSDSLFLQFEHLFRALLKALGPAVETRIYAKMVHYLKKVRYHLSINPLPYNQIVSQGLLFSLKEMIEQGKLLNPENREIFNNISEVLDSLHNHKSNALFECLRQKNLRFSSYSYCIVTKRDMHKMERDYILKKISNFDITFMNEKKFRKEKRVFDYVVFMGNENYFHHSFNNTPKSKVTAFISRDIYQNEFLDNSLFIEWPFRVFSTMYKGIDTEKVNFVYPLPKTELSVHAEEVLMGTIGQEIQIQEPDFSLPFIKFMAEISHPLDSAGIELDDKRERVQAKAFELHGEKFIFIRVSKGLHDVITENGVFIRKQVNEIVTGDSLVLSSVSDDRLVERMADVMYEQQNIKLYRQHQTNLRNYLLKTTEKKGIDGFCRLLKRKGLSTITEAKIKNLLKPTSFKLQNKKEYFEFLSILSKNDEQKAMRYFEAGRRLAVFHISAGKKVRQMLREMLGSADLTELLVNGVQLIELKELEGLKLEIRKVEVIGNNLVNIFPYQNKKIITY